MMKILNKHIKRKKLDSLNEVPEDILNGIETMSDDELAVLMQHPELIDLIQKFKSINIVEQPIWIPRRI